MYKMSNIKSDKGSQSFISSFEGCIYLWQMLIEISSIIYNIAVPNEICEKSMIAFWTKYGSIEKYDIKI